MTRQQRNFLWFGTFVQFVGGAILVWRLGWWVTIGVGILLWGYGLSQEIRAEIKIEREKNANT